jgi:hypothetical protein
MVNPDVKPPTEAVPESQKSETAINIVTGKDDSKTLNTMIEMADEVFDHNPRNVKQFVNMFRLEAFIANETGLFGSWRKSTRTGRPLTIPQLGKFVVLCMRWPDFVVDASADSELVRVLESVEATSQDPDEMLPEPTNPADLTGRAAFWFEDQGLINLLKFGLFAEEYTLSDVDFRLLTEIAPPRPKSDAEQEQEAAAASPAGTAPAPRAEAAPQSNRAPTPRPSRSSADEPPGKYRPEESPRRYKK